MTALRRSQLRKALPSLIVSLIVCSFFFTISVVHAQPTINTESVNATTSSTLYQRTLNYETTRTYSEGIIYTGVTFGVGQKITSDGPDYPPSNKFDNYFAIYRSALFFDLTTIPAGATINNAILSLYVSSDWSTADFNVTVQSGMPTYPSSPVIGTDYNQSYYSGTLATENTSTITGSGWWNITFTPEGVTTIETYLGEELKLLLRSSKDIAGTSPTLDVSELLILRSALSADAPKLVITYTTKEYTYTLNGPYLETGLVYNGTVNIVASFDGAESTSLTFSGISGVAQTVSFTNDYPLVSIFWNITSTYDRQRTIMVRNVNGDETEFNLYVPNSDDIVYQCSIGITDFAGLSNGYAQVLRNINGTNKVVMQTELDVNSAMPFWLIYYAQYDFRIISDQGTFTWGLPADGVTSKTFTVTYDMISHAYTGGNFTISASRPTAENITVSYVDNSGNTSSVTTVIKHLEQGSYVTDYTQTDEASTQSFSWTEAKASINYVVTITATIAGEEVVWQYGLSSTLESDYWNGFFDLFGAFPFPATQLIGIVIGALFFCVGNWRDIEAFTALGVIVTAILAIIGWVTVPTLGLGASFLVVVFMYLSKGKKENPYA
jgi:hypothetical protein